MCISQRPLGTFIALSQVSLAPGKPEVTWCTTHTSTFHYHFDIIMKIDDCAFQQYFLFEVTTRELFYYIVLFSKCRCTGVNAAAAVAETEQMIGVV